MIFISLRLQFVALPKKSQEAANTTIEYITLQTPHRTRVLGFKAEKRL